jgi:hypothetical protein
VESARNIFPSFDYDENEDRSEDNSTWASPENVSVKYIGETDVYDSPVTILSSFNAGSEIDEMERDMGYTHWR